MLRMRLQCFLSVRILTQPRANARDFTSVLCYGPMINDSFGHRHAEDKVLRNSFAGQRNHLLSQNMIQQSSNSRMTRKLQVASPPAYTNGLGVRSTRVLRCSSSKADGRRTNIKDHLSLLYLEHLILSPSTGASTINNFFRSLFPSWQSL